MNFLFWTFIVLAIFAAILKALAPVLMFLGIAILAVLGICLTFVILKTALRFVYHGLNPSAKKRYQAEQARVAQAAALRKATEAAQLEVHEAAARAEERARQQREDQRLRDLKEARVIEEQRRLNALEVAEQCRKAHRDADEHRVPYMYEIGNHANESLAIRYGIANQERKIKEYWYFAKGGEKVRNPERDTFYFVPASTMRLQKLRRVEPNVYDVLLTDFHDRPARAVIEVGTEYIKTFYPINDNWFKENAHLELVLKGNGTFSLKELATFHVQKSVSTNDDSSLAG